MLTLNGIPEGRARENADWIGDLLRDARVARSTGGADDETVGRLALELGLFRYALQSELDEVRRLLTTAAHHLALALTLRRPPGPNEHRNPWEGEQFIDVITCFGTAHDRAALAGLEPWQYRSGDYPDHDALVRYLGALCRYVPGAPLDVEALGDVTRACDVPRATREERLYLLPATRGLSAVGARETDGWNQALAALLAAHVHDARHGDFRLRPEGYVSLRALALAQLGRRVGLACRVESDYLPLSLLSAGTS